MTVPIDDGIFPDVEETAYHQDRGSLSVSGAKLLLPPSCPAKFRHQQDNPPPPKSVFDFGSLAHALILGAGPEIEILDPAVHGLKADGTVADVPAMTGMWKKAAAKARAAGKLPVSTDDYAAALGMRDAVMAHPIAGGLFTNGRPEVSLYHHDTDSGVRLRGRADWLTSDGDIIDLKTAKTANIAELGPHFWRYGYHMQEAWYRALVVALGINPDPSFTFVVVDKTPPYPVVVVKWNDEAVAEGERLNRLAIRTYAECMESGVWPGYSDGRIETISLPGWVVNQARAETDLAEAESIIAELEGLYQ